MDTKAALVTGGGRGIGRAISVELARQGHDVAIGWVRDDMTFTSSLWLCNRNDVLLSSIYGSCAFLINEIEYG